MICGGLRWKSQGLSFADMSGTNSAILKEGKAGWLALTRNLKREQ